MLHIIFHIEEFVLQEILVNLVYLEIYYILYRK